MICVYHQDRKRESQYIPGAPVFWKRFLRGRQPAPLSHMGEGATTGMSIPWQWKAIGYSKGLIQINGRSYPLDHRALPVGLSGEQNPETFELTSEHGKFADSEDSFLYCFFQIDPRKENVKISALGLQNATNQIHELDEKINNIEKGQIENQSKIDIAIANLKSSSSEPKVEPLDLEKYALTEAHYLIKMSFRKMYLEKDISTAIALLKDANDVLARVDEPNFLRIQKSINNDIIRLSKLEISDSEEIILRLCAMDENIKSLPVLGYKVNFNESADSEETPNQVSENIEDWKENVWSNTVNFLGKLVVVKKKDENVDRVFLTKDQITILQNKISMFLLQAQLAVYAQQQTVYEQSLNKVSELVNGYFDKEDTSTEHALIEIKDLKSLNVLFIGLQQYESLDVIQQYLMRK